MFFVWGMPIFIVATRSIDSRFVAGIARKGQNTRPQGVLGTLSECIFRKLRRQPDFR